MKTLLAAIIVTIALLSQTACNTVKGVGQDIESVGDAMDDAVR